MRYIQKVFGHGNEFLYYSIDDSYEEFEENFPIILESASTGGVEVYHLLDEAYKGFKIEMGKIAFSPASVNLVEKIIHIDFPFAKAILQTGREDILQLVLEHEVREYRAIMRINKKHNLPLEEIGPWSDNLLGQKIADQAHDKINKKSHFNKVCAFTEEHIGKWYI